jgi:hypothetical protein
MRLARRSTAEFLVLLCLGAGLALAATEESLDNLIRVASSKVDVLYVAHGASLAKYHKVMLDPVDVSFKADWHTSHPEVTGEDVARLRGQFSASFHDSFVRELQVNGGYPVVTQPGPDVLELRASIRNLDISAPDTRAPGPPPTKYVISPGEMTLIAELRDSESGAVLARAADRKQGRQTGQLEVATEATNAAAAQRAFQFWASVLRGALDAAREGGAPP